jgi:hypothetical protein
MADVHVRRRRNALAAVAGVALLTGMIVGATAGGDSPPPAEPKLAELPGGGRTILPGRRVVALYGHPGADSLGELGIGTPAQAGRKLLKQARAYRTPGVRVLPAMELISTLAQNAPQASGTYSARLPHRSIRRYLKAARRVNSMLILDIQPGRGQFGPEIDYVSRYLAEPDVGLALDPEWKVGPTEIPGQVIGSMEASEVNLASAYLSKLVKARKLPQKLLLVHQFTTGGIKNYDQLKRYPGVGLAINIDGFAGPAGKISKYEELTELTPDKAHGFKLFYDEDRRIGGQLMTARQVLRLNPQPSVVVYE